MCGRERSHIKILNVVQLLCEGKSEEKAQESYIKLLEEAKSGVAGLRCIKGFKKDDVLFSTIDGTTEFSTPQSRKLKTRIKDKWYTVLRSLL